MSEIKHVRVDWVDDIWNKHIIKLEELKKLPKDELVPCRPCNGQGDPRCRCKSGQVTVQDAIDDLETELEILAK